MNLRPRRRAAPEVNITSLIDVVFLLLIFFMVSTTFDVHRSELEITLPQGVAGIRPDPESSSIEVRIDAEGRYEIQGKVLADDSRAALRTAVAAAAGGAADRPVVVSADGRTVHQAVIRVMDVLSELRLTRVSFPMQPVDDGP